MKHVGALLLLMIVPRIAFAGPTEDEAAVWQLEEDYWKLCQGTGSGRLPCALGRALCWLAQLQPTPSEQGQYCGLDPPLHRDPTRFRL